MERWFGELAEYGVGQQNVLTKELFGRPNTQIGHYSQVITGYSFFFFLNEDKLNAFYLEMVWQNTYRVGCYVEWCSHMTYVVCQYAPKFVIFVNISEPVCIHYLKHF